MKTASQWFSEYGQSHQNKINKMIHWICVPAIYWSVALILWSIPRASWMSSFELLNWATLTLALVMVFYMSISLSIAAGMLVVSALMIWGTQWMATNALWPLGWIGVALFVVAWIFQFIGHRIEGKRPSFFKDLLFLLVGPAWLLGFVYKKLGLSYA